MEPISPPTDLLTLESLPFDTQKKIALNLPYETISSLCTTSKKLKRVCNDIYFWRDYLKIQVPVNIDVPSGASIRWYKDKIKQYPKVKVITDLLDEGKATRDYIQQFNNTWNIFDRVENLQGLYCANNQLTSLPSMPNLQILYCENNKLTSIPSMPNLQYLYCENNKLTSLPSYPNLRRLYCQDNGLSFLLSLPNLEALNCKNNILTSLPPFPNLLYLECEGNPLPGFTLEYWDKIWEENK